MNEEQRAGYWDQRMLQAQLVEHGYLVEDEKTGRYDLGPEPPADRPRLRAYWRALRRRLTEKSGGEEMA